MTKGNNKLIDVGHATCARAYAFCVEYERTFELRKLNDTIRKHLQDQEKYYEQDPVGQEGRSSSRSQPTRTSGTWSRVPCAGGGVEDQAVEPGVPPGRGHFLHHGESGPTHQAEDDGRLLQSLSDMSSCPAATCSMPTPGSSFTTSTRRTTRRLALPSSRAWRPP